MEVFLQHSCPLCHLGEVDLNHVLGICAGTADLRDSVRDVPGSEDPIRWARSGGNTTAVARKTTFIGSAVARVAESLGLETV